MLVTYSALEPFLPTLRRVEENGSGFNGTYEVCKELEDKAINNTLTSEDLRNHIMAGMSIAVSRNKFDLFQALCGASRALGELEKTATA